VKAKNPCASTLGGISCARRGGHPEDVMHFDPSSKVRWPSSDSDQAQGRQAAPRPGAQVQLPTAPTPGPWSYLPRPAGEVALMEFASGRCRVVLCASDAQLGALDADGNSRLVPFSPDHPDARLFAAGPDLLDAAYQALGLLVSADVDPVFQSAQAGVVATLRAAIAKATGRAS
jgi:hypothetical protein